MKKTSLQKAVAKAKKEAIAIVAKKLGMTKEQAEKFIIKNLG